MKKIRFSVYIIVPLIFSGLTIFTGIFVHSITLHFGRYADPQNTWAIYGAIFALAILAYLASFVILRVLLMPLKKFTETTAHLPILSTAKITSDNEEEYGEKELVHYGRILEHASNLLGKVEARELFPEIIGQSKAMREIFGQILKVAPTDTTVLLMGESGTGKEMVARAIYQHSHREGKPFIILNCVAIPEGLFESELFGHEKGSFTGAVAQKIGKLELADGGTIFFDEIGDMPLNAQAKLLRVLQENNFERVGGTKSVLIDVRIIAATNKNLVAMVKTGAFREDLFYRLNVFAINLPELRQRREDIPFLVQYFLEQAGKTGKISDPAMQILTGHNWPGNVRELKNCLERAAVLSGDDLIEPGHLPDYVKGNLSEKESEAGENLDERIRMVEKGLIINALKKTDGVQSKAAELLGINQRSLWHRVKKHNIDMSALKK
jgi:transcriptional regulator with GAF, ATPase, and Fis domain